MVHADKRTMRIRHVLLSPLLAALTLLGFTAAAPAATTLGQLDPAPTGDCTGGSLWTVASSVTVGYAAPSAGVITSWSTRAHGVAGRELGLRTYRLQSGTTYRVVGSGGIEILTPSTVNTFATRVSVQSGDIVGLWVGNYTGGVGGGASCAYTAAGGDTSKASFGHSTEPAVGTDHNFGTNYSSTLLNVTATLEADADADGYGDETQDQCPTDASTTGTCPAVAPPDGAAPTLGLKAPRKVRLARRAISIEATSDEAATLTLSGETIIKGKRHRLPIGSITKSPGLPATTSLKLKLPRALRERVLRALRNGRMASASLTLTATDAAGNVAQATARVKLKR